MSDISSYQIVREDRPMTIACVFHGGADNSITRWVVLETFNRAICEPCFKRLAAAFSAK